MFNRNSNQHIRRKNMEKILLIAKIYRRGKRRKKTRIKTQFLSGFHWLIFWKQFEIYIATVAGGWLCSRWAIRLKCLRWDMQPIWDYHEQSAEQHHRKRIINSFLLLSEIHRNQWGNFHFKRFQCGPDGKVRWASI